MSLLQGRVITPTSSQFRHLSHFTCEKSKHFSVSKIHSSLTNPTTQDPVSAETHLSIQSPRCLYEKLQTNIGFCLSLPLISLSAPSFAAETATQTSSDKFNVETFIISVDDFLTRYPFFAAGVAFIWLVAIPLAKGTLKKYKPIKALNAFVKLRKLPEAQLLDIRKDESVRFMESPNLKILNKSSVWVKFEEGKEDEFVKNVLYYFSDPENTVLCILDNFDGSSLKVAELLHNNGFKEAYAIKGGVRGKEGWLEIQKECLPPSVAMWPKKSTTQLNGQSINYGDDFSTINDNPNQKSIT